MAEFATTPLRDALAWLTNDQENAQPSKNPFEWFWEAIHGDFSDDRSTGQIAIDAAISMIPLVDQVCDVRDLIANCIKLRKDPKDPWAWVALALTLIGLFPTLGSLVKGVLKIFFAFVRKMGGDRIAGGVESSMKSLIDFLRRRNVQRYLKAMHIDEVFSWLASQVKTVRDKVSLEALLSAFDRGIAALESLAAKVKYLPGAAAKAKSVLEQVREIRLLADECLARALKPVHDVLNTIIMRLEREAIEKQNGIVNANNIHFRGSLPEAEAVTLMRKADPPPSWLSSGKNLEWPPADYDQMKDRVDKMAKEGWPPLGKQNVESFHQLVAAEIKGPARLYRVISPTSRAMSDCWVSEEIFKKIQSAPDPRAAWRKYLGVWPDWNVNGQFVIFDVKPGESLKAWRGKAASQAKPDLPDHHLEGGWEQIVFNIPRGDKANDLMRYYKLKGGKGNRLEDAITQEAFNKLSKQEKDAYTGVRESINHPKISGPFDTGWGCTDFGGAGLSERIGLPSLRGQRTNLID